MNMLDESMRGSWEPSLFVCVLSDMRKALCLDKPSGAVCTQCCPHFWRILSLEADTCDLDSAVRITLLISEDRTRYLGCSQPSVCDRVPLPHPLPMLCLRILALAL